MGGPTGENRLSTCGKFQLKQTYKCFSDVRPSADVHPTRTLLKGRTLCKCLFSRLISFCVRT